MSVITEAPAVGLRERLRDYIDLTKPRILLLSVLTVLGAMSVASQGNWPASSVTLATVIGVALAVGAGGTLNCFIERHADGLMARTAHRPLPSGRLRPAHALVWGTTLWVLSYFVLYFFSNPLAAFLTMVAFGSYVGIYTPLKRHTGLSTLVGTVPGALPPVIGWAAARGHVEPGAWILFSWMVVWQIPHFLALALLRRDDYAQAGMPMLPTEVGEKATIRQMFLYTTALLPLSLLPYGVLGAGPLYLGLALLLGAGFWALAWQGLRRGATNRWCRTFFFYSIVYLAILFSVLVLDL